MRNAVNRKGIYNGIGNGGRRAYGGRLTNTFDTNTMMRRWRNGMPGFPKAIA